MIPNNPITLKKISDLNKIGIQTPESINLNSSQYVSMLYEIDGKQQIIIFNYQTQTIAHKTQIYKVSAVSIHPQKDIIAVIANNVDGPTTIQLLNFNSKIKLKQMQLNESVIYTKWVTCNILAFVTLTKVFHFRLDLNNFDNECELLMELHKDLTDPTIQIIGYCADHSETWFALQAISLCEQKINLKGHIQLYNVQLNKQQILQGHCCCFGQYDVHQDIQSQSQTSTQYESSLFAFIQKQHSDTYNKLLIIEIESNNKHQKFKQSSNLKENPACPHDIPILLYLNRSIGTLQIITKFGNFNIYSITSCNLIYQSCISDSNIYSGTQLIGTEAYVVLPKSGVLIQIMINGEKLNKYLESQQETEKQNNQSLY